MPLSSDPQVNELSQNLVSQLHSIFGKHPGHRAAHAKGILLKGVFTPSTHAQTLSKAPHFQKPTPITARFSSSTGIPNIPDTDSNGNPRDLAIRFHLAERVHTDIITHSTPYFPARTGAEFLEFLEALVSSSTKTLSPSPVKAFLGAHPAALAFVQAPKPTPASFVTEKYWSVNAFKFVNAEGAIQFFRYRIVPEDKVEHLADVAVQARVKNDGNNFLYNDLPKRVPIALRLQAQLAEEGDVVDDATVQWPENRQVVELGRLRLEKVVDDVADGGKEEQRHIIFDPVPRVEGIEASGDPLLEVRADVYLIGGRERRNAKGE